MRRLIQVVKGNDGVVRSARVTMAHGEQEQTSSEIGGSLLEWFFQDQKQGLRCRHHLKSSSKIVREPEISFETEKSKICQNSKFVKTETFYRLRPIICVPPDFRKGTREKPELYAHG